MLVKFSHGTIANIVRQFDQLAINGENNLRDTRRLFSTSGFLVCALSNGTTLNIQSGSSFPLTEQRRNTFFPEWKYNYKNKHLPHKPRILPYYRWDFRQLEGQEYTHKPFRLKGLGGRSPETGKKVNQRIGGGYRFDWFWVDYRRNRFSPSDGSCYEERILEVRRAPNETAYVALAAGCHGRRWILATENMKAGDVIRSYNYIPNKMLKDYEMPEGDSWPLGALPAGSNVCNVQKRPDAEYVLTNDRPDYAVINAGGSATILRQQGEYTVLSIHKKLEIAVRRECIATIGRLSNVEHENLEWGSMNMKRRWGIKQGEGFWHKKDGYCGRKIKPTKRLTIDESEPAPIKIPITLTKKDYVALYGTAKKTSIMGRGRSNATTGKKGNMQYSTPVDQHRHRIGQQESKKLLKNETKQRRRKESERTQKKGAMGYFGAILVILTLILATLYLVAYFLSRSGSNTLAEFSVVPFVQPVLEYFGQFYRVWVQPYLPL